MAIRDGPVTNSEAVLEKMKVSANEITRQMDTTRRNRLTVDMAEIADCPNLAQECAREGNVRRNSRIRQSLQVAQRMNDIANATMMCNPF